MGDSVLYFSTVGRFLLRQATLYGHVRLDKEYCHACKSNFFVIDGKMSCCDGISKSSKIGSIKRESLSLKKTLSKSMKDRILMVQQYKCILCGHDLREDCFYRKKERFKKVHTEFDHFIPKSFSEISHFNNVYAMCCLCNRYKGSKMFDTIEDARKYVIKRRESLGLMELYTNEEMYILRKSV